MSRPLIKRIRSESKRELPIFEEIAQLQERIREHAFKLFQDRGHHGDDLAHWLEAEKEVCGSVSELIEEEHRYLLKIALAGFEPEDIEITATPREIIVKATAQFSKEDEGPESSSIRWSDFQSTDIYRHVELPIEVDIDQIAAKFERGLLTIEAPKTLEPKPETKKKISATSA